MVAVDIGILIKDKKYRTSEETQRAGARIFQRKFAGLILNKTRLETKALEIIVNLGLANDKTSAKEVLNGLVGVEIKYSRDGHDSFILRKYQNRLGETAYKLQYLGPPE